MELEKVTRKDLRSMRVGSTRIFHLVSTNKVESARVMARQLGLVDGTEYKCRPDYHAQSISITRIK